MWPFQGVAEIKFALKISQIRKGTKRSGIKLNLKGLIEALDFKKTVNPWKTNNREKRGIIRACVA
tara:strand:- start:48 stop:242 length:195 start_codon:yes stop_codon:yes gene_type:complete